MTREEFCALPPTIALGMLWDSLDPDTLRDLEAQPVPDLPRPPKYDSAIYRRGGVQYASETDLEGLRFWHQRATESAQSGGQYAAKDEKQAKALGYWIAWRKVEPSTPWSGERNHEHVVAAPPSAKPAIHPRSGGGQRQAAPAAADDGYDYGGEDGIPF